MKILLIDNPGCFLDFGLRCVEAGHEVRWFIGPTKEGIRNRTGDGVKQIKKVASWESHMDWADLIVLSDNVKYIDGLERYRKQGYPIFGPNKDATDWELDRDIGQRVFDQCGIESIESTEFSSYDKAKEFVLKTQGRYVSKPSGDADKALSYVSKSAADMCFMLDYWKVHQKKKAPFILQEFVPGLEMAVGCWFGPGGWSAYVLENFEHKKLMNGEKGPNCYSEDTEVLTKRGWLPFNEVTLDDDVASYQPKDGSVFYEKPLKLHWTDYEGDMVNFKSRYVDLLVTPSHQMWVAPRKKDSWGFWDASKTPSEFSLKLNGEYSPESKEDFILPAYTDGRGYTHKEISIPIDIWAGFLGLYLSEGSCSGGRVSIAQNIGYKKDEMESLIEKTPFNYKHDDKGFRINSVQLASYLKPYGHSHQKYIPKYIKYATKDVVNTFLNAYLLGDGDIHDGRRRWHTGSWKMVSDIQELLTIHGSSGVIVTDKRTEMTNPINGKTYKANPVYSIEESNRDKASIRIGQKHNTYYKGKIGCVTLSTTHLLFVRRNGRVAICGNTGEMGTAMKYCEWADSKLAQEMLEPFTGHLFRTGYTGYIDVAVIIDEQGNPWPLEFTTRPGWPLFQIQQVLHPEPAQFMKDCLDGYDSFEPSMDVAVGVVIALPDFPYSQKKKEELYGYPVYGITEENMHNIHPGEMARDIAPNDVNGKVKMEQMWVSAGDWLVTVSGTGKTVSKACKEAYKTVDQLSIPNSPLYRTDISHRLEKQLPKLQKLGYATSWVYE